MLGRKVEGMGIVGEGEGMAKGKGRQKGEDRDRETGDKAVWGKTETCPGLRTSKGGKLY